MWLALLSVIVAGMFGFAYANAEFFTLICQKIGLYGATANQLKTDPAPDGRVEGHPVDVYFTATVADGLPLAFSVKERFQKTRLNARTLNEYRFTNLADRTIYFRPVHDVQPTRANNVDTLELTKCFCFDLQKIDAGQSYMLPVEYTFTDVLDGTRVLTMNYTLFPSTKADYEKSLADAEQGAAK